MYTKVLLDNSYNSLLSVVEYIDTADIDCDDHRDNIPAMFDRVVKQLGDRVSDIKQVEFYAVKE